MSEWEEFERMECPMCGFDQTDESIHEKGKWFCYCCGCTWDPDVEDYDADLGIWIRWNEKKKIWEDMDGNEVD